MKSNVFKFGKAKASWPMAVVLVAIISSMLPSAKGADVVDRLCQHIQENRKKIILDGATNETEVVWSDGAMLEIGSNFPPALQKLFSRPTMYRNIRAVLHQLQMEFGWKEATATVVSGERYAKIQSLDGKVSIKVEALYIEYLRQRYPKARFHLKAEQAPVICTVDGHIRAGIMPVVSQSEG